MTFLNRKHKIKKTGNNRTLSTKLFEIPPGKRRKERQLQIQNIKLDDFNPISTTK